MLQFNTELQTTSGGQSVRVKLTLALHKIPAQNRFAASIAASKGLYSFFLDLT